MSEDDITEMQGGELRTLPNGAIYDMRRKRIVGAPPKEKQFITQENASALSTLRWDGVRGAIVAGGIRAADTISPGNKTEYDAAVMMGERAFTQAMTNDKREGVEWGRLYTQLAGWSTQADQQQPAIRIEISGDGLRALAGIVAGGLQVGGSVQGDVIDGEISEVEDE